MSEKVEAKVETGDPFGGKVQRPHLSFKQDNHNDGGKIWSDSGNVYFLCFPICYYKHFF